MDIVSLSKIHNLQHVNVDWRFIMRTVVLPSVPEILLPKLGNSPRFNDSSKKP